VVDVLRTERFTIIAATPLSAEMVERVTGADVLPPDRGLSSERGTSPRIETSIADVLAKTPLPTLHFADGHTIPIDGTMLIGRSPRVERAATTTLPRLVPVGDDSAAVSRTHLRVTVEGDRILLEDLDSTNGTAVLPVDGAPFRLAPGQPALLTDGMVVTIAQHLAFRVVTA
jgi:hypothetical protein